MALPYWVSVDVGQVAGIVSSLASVVAVGVAVWQTAVNIRQEKLLRQGPIERILVDEPSSETTKDLIRPWWAGWRSPRLPVALTINLGVLLAGLAIIASGVVDTPIRVADLTRLGIPMAGILLVRPGAVTVGLLLVAFGSGGLGFDLRYRVADKPVVTAGLQPTVRSYKGFRAKAHDPIVNLCRKYVSSKDLHYVAYYVGRECIVHVDVLNDPFLDRYFESLSRADRRSHYSKYGIDLEALMASLNTRFSEMDSGILIRLVLDVQRGAIYYFVVHQESNRYLIGVTLDQDMVHVVDSKLADLVDAIRQYLHLPRLTELVRH
jgi:hypothetical protein